MTENNLFWHHHRVTEEDLISQTGHQPAILWFTGLSASGKSTIAGQVVWNLYQRGCRTFILDGDNIRHGLSKDLGFSPQDRSENIRRVGEVAKLFIHAGHIVATAFISPYRADREMIRNLVPTGQFIEIFTDCSLEVCEQRDPKRLYRQVREGKIPNFTGIGAPYEAPENPEIRLDTDRETIESCTVRVINALVKRKIIHDYSGRV